MQTATKPRRKWYYCSRELAEQTAARLRESEGALIIALNAQLNGNLVWLPKYYGTSENYYRFAFVPRSDCATVLVQYHAPGQRPHAAAYLEQWVTDEISRWSRHIAADDVEAIGYRQGLYDLRAAVYNYQQGE
jgi:hypothetical protein